MPCVWAHRCSGSQHGIIRKYGLMMTRRDFREKAEIMGWKKVCVALGLVGWCREDMLCSGDASQRSLCVLPASLRRAPACL